jgi:hypothetical protein
MRQLLLFMLLMSFVSELHASLRQVNYRWRKDDGSETTATWLAAENTQANISDMSNVRLRYEFDNDNGIGDYAVIRKGLEFSSDNGLTWNLLTNPATNPFQYAVSPNVTNGTLTTAQITATTAVGTFVPGQIITNGTGQFELYDLEKTELEWVLQPTANIIPNVIYQFRIPNDPYNESLEYTNTAKIKFVCDGVIINGTTPASNCGPGSVTLSATSTVPAGTINWYATSTSLAPIGNGSTFTTPVLTSNTTYFVSVTMGACTSPRVPVMASIYPIPSVNIGADDTICANRTKTLNAGTGYNSYLWDNGTTQPTRTVAVAGTYFVTTTSAGGCKASDTVQIFTHTVPQVNLGNDTLVCPNVTLVLDAGNPGDSYLWDNGTTQQTRAVSETGTYFAQVTNPFGCKNADTVKIIVKDKPLGNINAVYYDTAMYVFDVLNDLYSVGYVWDFGDGSPLEYDYRVYHRYTQNGIYTVTLSLLGDCGVDQIRQRTIDVFDAGNATGTQNLNKEQLGLTLYPNPAKESLSINVANSNHLQSITISTITGQVIYDNHNINANSIIIPTGTWSTGLYVVKTSTNLGVAFSKIEVIK